MVNLRRNATLQVYCLFFIYLLVLYTTACDVKQKNQVEFLKREKVVAFGACPCIGDTVCKLQDDSVSLGGKLHTACLDYDDIEIQLSSGQESYCSQE